MSVLERCPSYRESNKWNNERQGPILGVRLVEVSVKRDSTVYRLNVLLFCQILGELICLLRSTNIQRFCRMPIFQRPCRKHHFSDLKRVLKKTNDCKKERERIQKISRPCFQKAENLTLFQTQKVVYFLILRTLCSWVGVLVVLWAWLVCAFFYRSFGDRTHWFITQENYTKFQTKRSRNHTLLRRK